MDKDFYYFWLTFLTKIPLRNLHAYVDYFGGAKAFFEAAEEELTGLTEGQRRQICSMKQREDIPCLWEERKQKSYHFLSCEDEAYPQRLKELADIPFGIYYEGNLPLQGQPVVAVVGARNSTVYGQELAYQISQELGKQGVSVISGLAVGIDASAHRGCMDGGGDTFGVLGSGIRVLYPKENYDIYMKMRTQGGILTEYPPDTKPLPMLFPRRNRIISILADFVLVVEAREKSGSFITVDFALEQGRNVGAVPGRPCDALHIGCNRLIQQGAKCILSAADVLEELMDSSVITKITLKDEMVNPDLGLAPKEKMVYSCLRLEPKFIDEILCQLNLPVWETIQILTELEIKGVVRQNPHHYFYKLM